MNINKLIGSYYSLTAADFETTLNKFLSDVVTSQNKVIDVVNKNFNINLDSESVLKPVKTITEVQACLPDIGDGVLVFCLSDKTLYQVRKTLENPDGTILPLFGFGANGELIVNGKEIFTTEDFKKRLNLSFVLDGDLESPVYGGLGVINISTPGSQKILFPLKLSTDIVSGQTTTYFTNVFNLEVRVNGFNLVEEVHYKKISESLIYEGKTYTLDGIKFITEVSKIPGVSFSSPSVIKSGDLITIQER